MLFDFNSKAKKKRKVKHILRVTFHWIVHAPSYLYSFHILSLLLQFLPRERIKLIESPVRFDTSLYFIFFYFTFLFEMPSK